MRSSRRRRPSPTIDQNAIDRAADALRRAERPLIVVGGGAQDAGDAIAALAELLQAPVTTRRMGHGAIPTAHPLFVHLAVGHALWKTADVVIGIGSRLEWPLMFWGTDDGHDDRQDRHRPRRARPPRARHDRRVRRRRRRVPGAARRARRHAAVGPTAPRRSPALRAEYFADIDHLRPQLDFLAAIRDVLPDDGIFVEDVTQIGFAAHLAFDFRRPRTFQSTGPAGTLGAGYAQGLGAQVALEREGRGRKALVVAGDGGFLFTGNELATAVQHEIPLVCCVFDDGAFGNVKRIQQQRFGDDRTIASTLRNPDFVAYARASARSACTPTGPTSCARGSTRRSAPACRRSSHVSTGPMPDPWPLFLEVAGADEHAPARSPPSTAAGCARSSARCSAAASTDLIEIPVPAWLVRHGDDVVVFDAGLHPSLAGSSEPLGRDGEAVRADAAPTDGTVGPRLEQHDVDPRGSFTVVVSHCHFDHVGGLCEMPNARVVVERRRVGVRDGGRPAGRLRHGARRSRPRRVTRRR